MFSIKNLVLPAIVLCLVAGLIASSKVLPKPSMPVAADTHIGQAVADFALPDHRGKTHSLAELSDKRIVVVVFLGAECPLAQLYAPRLAALFREYEPRGVAFVGIDANAQDSLAAIAAYVRSHQMPFSILKDPDRAVADRFGAVRTPEAFVLDGDRVVRYWGRIDDQHSIGIRADHPQHRDLADALDDLLADRPVARPVVPSVGCRIGRVPRGAPTGDVTYVRHIRPLLEKRCVECHRAGEIGPFALTDYRSAVAWSAMIREVVDDGRMPPWFADPAYGHFKNDARLTDAEKRLLAAWIDNHCPEGELDSGDHAAPTRFPPGWAYPGIRIGILSMAAEPHRVPAEGELEYQYFLVDPGFSEDMYLQAAEVRPGNRAVVHHALVALVPPGDTQTRFDTLGALLDYAPGMSPMILPEGTALRIPAGSKFLFQMHYTPNGSPQQDQSRLGLIFADPRTVTRQVEGAAVMNQAIDIPPGAADHRLGAEHVFPEDVRLLSLSPHMHLRGKSFRFEARFPDGRREILLDVPRYDFNWQLRYDFAEPRPLPRGTRLVCTARYDNSGNNPANPDSTKSVGWGDQTRDEMLIGFLAYVR